jgi:hypothetical protein
MIPHAFANTASRLILDDPDLEFLQSELAKEHRASDDRVQFSSRREYPDPSGRFSARHHRPAVPTLALHSSPFRLGTPAEEYLALATVRGSQVNNNENKLSRDFDRAAKLMLRKAEKDNKRLMELKAINSALILQIKERDEEINRMCEMAASFSNARKNDDKQSRPRPRSAFPTARNRHHDCGPISSISGMVRNKN